MFGLIVTGHGKFASGMESTLRLLVELNPAIVFIDFSEDKTPDNLKEDFIQAINNLEKISCEKIVFLCDILGGTPFKLAAEIISVNSSISIIYGIHLPLLVDLALNQDNFKDSELEDKLVIAVKEAKQQIDLFAWSLKETIDNEGI
ncbi:MAG: hypothetical protein PHF63_09580 [Herbinix sp.]|nr:hypothetical protein [Herbinix sp.]